MTFSNDEITNLLIALLDQFVKYPEAEFEISGITLNSTVSGLFDIFGIELVENFGTKFIVKQRDTKYGCS